MPQLFDATRDDADALAVLHASAFPDPWSEQAICDLLAGPGVFVFFSEHGFVMGRAAGDEAEILTLAVKPDARGRGFGRTLIQALAAHAEALGAGHLFLEVRHDNAPALALYAGLGFKQVGQRKGYYEGRDAWVLKTSLPLSLARKFA